MRRCGPACSRLSRFDSSARFAGSGPVLVSPLLCCAASNFPRARDRVAISKSRRRVDGATRCYHECSRTGANERQPGAAARAETPANGRKHAINCKHRYGRLPARQAGGHWFEPSTAHSKNPRYGGVFVFRRLCGLGTALRHAEPCEIRGRTRLVIAVDSLSAPMYAATASASRTSRTAACSRSGCA